MKLFDELKKYCDKHGIRLQIDVFRKDKNRYELTFDYYEPEELRNIRDIISDYAKIENDVHLAGNGRAIDVYFETLDESKKSIKEAKTVTCISCEKNLNDYRNDPTCTQTWDYADGDTKWYQKSIHACIEDAKKFMKKGYLCYIDGELFDKPDVFDDTSYFKMEIKPKSSAKKSMKESKSDLLIDIQNLISSSGLLDSIADVEDTLEIAYMIAERLDPSDYGFKDEDALANKINFELKYDREYAKLFESKKFVRKSIKKEYDPTDDIINKGNSVGMDYETFLEFAEKQDYKFNVTDATFYFGINGNIKIEGRECSCIPSEDGILIIDNHSSIEIPRKDIDEVSGVSLNSKNVLRMDVFTKDGDALTVWWEL